MGTTLLPAQHLALGRTRGQNAPVQSSPALSSHSSRKSSCLRLTLNSPTGSQSRSVVTNATVRAATLYDVLELPRDVALSDIKRAYRQLARRYHPDVCSSAHAEESTRRFIEIQEAYETLADPGRRAVYDHAVAMGRGSASTGRMPWCPSHQDRQSADWKLQWESQLYELKCQSSMRARRRMDSWAAQMRMQNNGLHET